MYKSSYLLSFFKFTQSSIVLGYSDQMLHNLVVTYLSVITDNERALQYLIDFSNK